MSPRAFGFNPGVLTSCLLVIVLVSQGFALHARAAAPSVDPFTEICNSIFDSIMKRVGASKEKPIGPRAFEHEMKTILERQIPAGALEIKAAYMDLVFREWVSLGDPAYHLAVLKYPVPEAAIDVLESALINRIASDQIGNLLTKLRFKGSRKEVLFWVQRLLEHPELKNGNLLHALAVEYKKSIPLLKDRIKYLSGVPVLPDLKPGHVRMYKGSNFYRGPALSQSQVGKSAEEVGDGGLVFMDQEDANTHSVKAEAFHPDGVSVSTDKTVPINYGSHIRIYDVPEELLKRIPRGAPGLNEYVFKYSVPERFRVKTLPKATYIEMLKQEGKGAYSYGELVRRASGISGAELLAILESSSDPILIRGKSLYFSSLLNERTPDLDRSTIQIHVLKVFAQSEKYSHHLPWQEIEAPPNVNVRSVLNFAFAVHDVGKPLAAEFRTPHQMISAEILEQMMNKAGYSRAEVELGRALVGHDLIGTMLQGVISPHEAFDRLIEISRKTNLNPRDFFKIQSFFHIMDASSYSDLTALFVREGEMLVPKNEKFAVLRNLFENVEIVH
ncbi:MAG: hypothetical protein KGP28_08495 [Bdellovibrionales bacterium]|nr:hypothetical protein [Bdellovibrionales bacterium]